VSTPAPAFIRVRQTFANATVATLGSESGRLVLRTAIAASLPSVSPSHIRITNVTSESVDLSAAARRRLTLVLATVVAYEIEVDFPSSSSGGGGGEDTGSVLTALTTQLRSAIASGNFTRAVQTAARALNISSTVFRDLVADIAPAISIATAQPSDAPSKAPALYSVHRPPRRYYTLIFSLVGSFVGVVAVTALALYARERQRKLNVKQRETEFHRAVAAVKAIQVQPL
jgi:hypothetical protein